MQQVAEILYRVVTLALAVYGLWFGGVSLCFLLRPRPAPEPRQRLRFAVLVAARNEERCIAGLVESIKAQDYPPELVDIYVIPNNCSDATAAVAQASGAKIIPVSPGVSSKGQALHEAIEKLLASESHDAYCVFDADNEAHPHFLAEMNRALADSRAAKSRILAKNPREGWVCACYETYFCNANLMLNTSRSRLGLSARLIGTGFALRRELLEELGGWNTRSLTEDAEFYALLSARGERVAFAPGAITYDEQPLSFRRSLVQRRRWMSGVMEVARESLPELLRSAIRGPGRLLAADALLQLSFAWVQALLLPAFLLHLAAFPAQAAAALPVMVLKYCLSTAAVGAVALAAEKRLTLRTAAALPLYPIFIFSFLPLQTLSLFLPNKSWTPIPHTGVRLKCGDAVPRNIPRRRAGLSPRSD